MGGLFDCLIVCWRNERKGSSCSKRKDEKMNTYTNAE